MRLLHMADKIFGARVPGAATSPGVGAGRGVHPCYTYIKFGASEENDQLLREQGLLQMCDHG